MTQRSRFFLYGGLAILAGILLFIALFYGIRELTYEGGEDADENFLAFAVGLGAFIVCAIAGASLVTVGMTKPRQDA